MSESNFNDVTTNSPIKWPKDLAADRDMIYESIDLLYHNIKSHSFSEEMSFIVSASRRSMFNEHDPIGVIHKMDVTTMPKFDRARIEVSHEVKPGLRCCSRIIHVNDRLKAGAFDSGRVMPIKNFGPKKTFHTDVRGSLHHHMGEITSLASDTAGSQMASACSSGRLTLYKVREEEITLLTRTDETEAKFITDLTFFQPPEGFTFGQADSGLYNGENILLYSTHDGLIGLIDTRCTLASSIRGEVITTIPGPVNITSMMTLKSRPGQITYLGSSRGDVFACDLRMGNQCVNHRKSPNTGTIQRMKEVVVSNGHKPMTFLAHTTEQNQIKILDVDTLEPSKHWMCDRLPEGRVRDLVQVGNRIVTCGDKTSIGCWEWSKPSQAL